MTREFHIKGITGLLLFLAMIAFLLLAIITIPSLLMMVMWNAVVFEGLKGPSIHLIQGILLTAMLAMVGKILLQPTIEVHFRKATTEELSQLQSFVESHQILDASEISAAIMSADNLAEQTVEVLSKPKKQTK